MNETTRILLLEDDPADAELAERELRRSGLAFASLRVETRAAFVAALSDFRPDLILADFNVPSFSGLDALSLSLQLAPTTPTLMVTGALSDETAADCIKAGAVDYLLKGRLARLPAAVHSALEHRRDLEENARSHEELRAAERRYRALFTESRDGMFVVDAATGRVVDANAAMLAMSGYRMEQLRGTAMLDLVSPASRAAAQTGWEATVRGGSVGAVEVELIRPDGTLLPVEIRGSAYTEADGAARLFGVVRDISERRQRERELRASEQRHRALFEEAPDAIFVADAVTGLFLDANRAGRELAGRDVEALRGMHQADLFPAEERDAVRTAFFQAAARTDHVPPQFRVLHRDGHLTPVEISSNLMADESGHPVLVGVFRDVTKRRAAEASALQSAERFRRVVEGAPEALFTYADGKLTYLNPAALRLFGAASAEVLLGQPVFDRVDPAYRATALERSRQTLEEHRPVPPLEEVFLRLDGTPFHVEVASGPFPHGDRPGALVFFRDIAERHAAELALHESEIRFRQVVEGGPEALFISTDLHFTYVNPAALNLFGAASAADLIGRSTLERISPDFHAIVRERARQLLGGLPVTSPAELVYLRLDGTPFDVEVSTVPFATGDGSSVLVFFRDVTESKRRTAELALLSTALTQAGEVAFITDTAGTIQYVNPAFERVTGYSAAEAIGRNPRILKSGVQSSEVYRRMWETLAAGQAFTGTFVNRRKNGDHYVAEVIVSPVRDASGAVVRYVAMQRDTTHEHDLEEQLRQAQKMEAVGQLTGGIAHDFNNLLGVILANTSLLGAALRGQEPEVRSYLADIEQSAAAGSAMVKKLLAFGRRERLAAAPLDLGHALRDVERTLRRFLPETIAIRMDVPEQGPSAVADGGALEQMLLNLGTNARDAMPGGGTLTITLREVEIREHDALLFHEADQPGSYVCVGVTDTGTGMDAPTMARIFEPFFTTKPPGAGTGLGLAMVFGLMKQHGGFVRAYSELGHGTTVRLYFPAAAEAGAAPDRAEAPARLLRGTETILVVEDQEMLRRATARALGKLGYQVLVAADGEEGLLMFGAHAEQISLIVSDRVMPDLGGVEMYQRLRGAGHRIRFLLMSGYAADVGGITPVPKELSVLEKPWTVEALAWRIRELLDAPPPA